MDNKGNVEVKTTGNIGFFGVLGIVFIVLKLTHVIDWPWIWVLAPIWGGVIISIILIIIFVIVGVIIDNNKWR